MLYYAFDPTNGIRQVQQLSPIKVVKDTSAVPDRLDSVSCFEASLHHAVTGEPSLQYMFKGKGRRRPW